jgi:hypothetical protein
MRKPAVVALQVRDIETSALSSCLPPRMSGTEDDGDDRDDEHAGENEAPVRAVDERPRGFIMGSHLLEVICG